MRSALYIGSKQNNPLTKTQIPSCASPNGMPFCFEYSGVVMQWQLVKDGEEYGYDLDVSWLTNDGKYIYYNGDVDLLEYLTGLGYDARAGRYYYSFRLDGVVNTEDYLAAVVSTSYTIAHSSKAYGEWDVDINYIESPSCVIYIIDDDNGGAYAVEIDYGDLSFSSYNNYTPTVLFNAEGAINSNGRYIINIKRNGYENEFVGGSKGTIAVYINDDLITPSTGVNPVTNNDTTSSVLIKWSSPIGVDLFRVDSLYPKDFTTITGEFDIKTITYPPSGGTIKQSNLFQLECEDTRPITPGDFNNDFSNDFF